MSLCQRILAFTAAVLGIAVLAISLTTLLHEDWIKYTVKGTTTVAVANRHYEYYPRSRGLIWTCVASNEEVLKYKKDEVKFSRCYEETYTDVKNGSTETYVINLRRTHLGLKSAGILFCIIGHLVGFAALMMWCLRPKVDIAKYRRFRGHVVACWVLSAMFSLTAMAIYHYVLDLEKYLPLPKLPRLYVNWPTDLKNNTTMAWGLMYYLEWGAICGLILAAFLLRESVTCFPEKEDGGKSGTPDDRTYLYHSNPMMMQLSSESLPPYDAYKTPASAHPPHTDDGQSARSGQSSRLPRYAGDSTYDNQAKNVYRIY